MNDLIGRLIEEITPLNNKYREGINANLLGKEILKIMWDVGEILFVNGIKNVHPVAWAIYGKEKGIRRSYITRDFLSYCFRVRKYFRARDEIDDKFPKLQKYSLFREAFPLLDNSKYSLNKREREELVNLLNSEQPVHSIKKKIIKIKREKLRIYNDRRQRLGEMVPVKENFIKIYKELSNLVLNNNLDEVKTFREKIGDRLLANLSQLCLSFTQEGLSFPKIDQDHIDKLDGEWNIFCNTLIRLSSSDIETRNRFRRVIPISKIMEVAEILNGVRTDEGYSHLLQKIKGFELKT